MQSTVKTITVPGTPTNNPALIAIAPDDHWIRVLVDNVGGTQLRLGFASSGLGSVTADSTDSFLMLVAASRVYVLAPKQRLFAVSIGADGQTAVAVSIALPIDKVG